MLAKIKPATVESISRKDSMSAKFFSNIFLRVLFVSARIKNKV